MTASRIIVKHERLEAPAGWTYLGVQGPWSGDDQWPVHVYAKDYRWRPAPMPVDERVQDPLDFNVSMPVIQRVHCGPSGPFPLNPAHHERPALEERGPFPAPALTSTDPLPEITPGPVLGLVMTAEGFGWECVTTAAVGHVPHATRGTPSAQPKSSWAARMQRGEQRAVAVRMDGNWTSLWTWSSTTAFKRHATLEAFKGALI